MCAVYDTYSTLYIQIHSTHTTIFIKYDDVMVNKVINCRLLVALSISFANPKSMYIIVTMKTICQLVWLPDIWEQARVKISVGPNTVRSSV